MRTPFARSDGELVGRAVEAGVMGYLVKPLRRAELAPTLELAIARFREARELGQRLEERKLIAAPELDAPVLVQNGALQALDEAVGPRMAGLGAGVADAQGGAGLREGAFELAAVGQQPPQRPAGALVERQEDVPQKGRGSLGALLDLLARR